MAALEGTLELRRHDDGRVEILNFELPERTRVSLDLLVGADPMVVKVLGGQRLQFGGQVVYRVIEWDRQSHSLVLALVEDGRR